MARVIECPRGQRVVRDVPIVDRSTGRLDARWLATDTPAARLWDGQERVSVALSAAWKGTPETDGATFTITVTDTVSGALVDGKHFVDLIVSRSGVETNVGGLYVWIRPGGNTANAGTLPRAYLTGQECRDIAGGFLDTLQSKYGQTANAEVLAHVSRRFDELLLGRVAEADRDDLQASLDADGLAVTASIREYLAWETISLLADRTPGGGADLDGLRTRARDRADRALRAVVAYVDGELVATFGGRAVRIER